MVRSTPRQVNEALKRAKELEQERIVTKEELAAENNEFAHEAQRLQRYLGGIPRSPKAQRRKK